MSEVEARNHRRLSDAQLDEWANTLNEDLTIENVERFLSNLPHENHPDYYTHLKTLFKVDNVGKRQVFVESIFSNDTLHIDTDRSTDDVRFSSLYFLVSYHRRKDNLGQFESWLENGREEFEDRLLFQYQESILSRERNEYPEAIDKCRPIIAELPDNYPLVHGFAHNIVHGIEQNLVQEEDEQELAAEAIEKLDPVLERIPEHGKVHATLARALAIDGQFDRAIRELDKAIENEDSAQTDYAERISHYYFHKTRIQLAQHQQEVRKDVEEAKSEVQDSVEEAEQKVDNIQGQLIQFIGFFTGLLAIVFTSTEIALSLPPDAAARIILIMISGLICAFASLGLLLPVSHGGRRFEGVLAMGVAGLFIGIIVLPMIP